MKPGYVVINHDRVSNFDRIAVENDPYNNIVHLWRFSADWSSAEHMMYDCVAIWKIKWK